MCFEVQSERQSIGVAVKSFPASFRQLNALGSVRILNFLV
ncbi:hypothetical protein ABID97_003610 [Variovorax sp. OAS795]